MKCSLGISNFLEEISSLSHSIDFLYFFALITEEGFISPCYSLELCIQMGICFLFALLFTSLLFTAICKASSDSHFALLHFFFLGMVLIPVSCTVSWTSVHSSSGTLSLKILQARLQQYVNCEPPDVQAGFRKGRGTNICQYLPDHRKSKRIPEKHLFLLYWLCQRLWLCGSPQTVENSERDGNTKPPELPLEKSLSRSESNS